MTRATIIQVIAAVGIALPVLYALAASEPAPEAGVHVPVRVVPLVTFTQPGPAELEFVVESTTDRGFRYVASGNPGRIHGLRFRMSRDGKELIPRSSQPHDPAEPREVIALGGGRHLVHRIDVKSLYGELAPGRYAIDVFLDQRVSSGLEPTPVKISQRVLYLRVKRQGE